MATLRNRFSNVHGPSQVIGGLLVVAGSLAACGGEEPASGPAGIEEIGALGLSPGAKHEILAEVEVGYGKVMFHRLDSPEGHTRVLVSELAPNGYSTTPFTKLAATAATHLELFQALQPGGTPPPLLTDLHRLEAGTLGRASTEVRQVPFDRDAPIQKSIASCEAFVYQDPPDTCGVRTWTNHRIANNISGGAGLHVGQFWAYATHAPVTLGICNESNAVISGRIGIDKGGDGSSAYTYWGWATLQPGWMWRWWDFQDVNGCRSCSGSVCSVTEGCTRASRYRVDGSSASGRLYHLRTAEAHETCGPF